MVDESRLKIFTVVASCAAVPDWAEEKFTPGDKKPKPETKARNLFSTIFD